jgi:hypothetical protein
VSQVEDGAAPLAPPLSPVAAAVPFSAPAEPFAPLCPPVSTGALLAPAPFSAAALPLTWHERDARQSE